MRFVFLFVLLFSSVHAQSNFNDYFHDKTLRFDYYHSGDKDSESFTFDELIEEPYWGGSKKNLIDTFYYGQYYTKIFDVKTNELIYSRGYSTLLHEYKTTEQAKTITKTLSETITFPYPKNKVRLEIYGRDSKNNFVKRYEQVIDPNSYFIKKENRKEYEKFKVYYSGDPAKNLDVVFLPEGFDQSEMQKFKEECNRFAKYLLENKPFAEYKEKINIWAVEAPSEDSGVDIPKDTVWKQSQMDLSYYTFYSERYLMTENNKSVRDVAANAPYDQIYILVNSDKYGGGAIYNYYNVCIVGNPYAEKVFLHEFGHGFAGLADEYYTSDVAYQNFYNLDTEPWEPNITTLIDFDKKWKSMIDENTPIPTPTSEKYKDKLGAFEGGGYMAKGVYRPTQNSIMLSLKNQEFNEVCKKAIIEMIKFYSE